MSLYAGICAAVEGLADALTAWAERERLDALEYQFDMAEGEDG